MRKENAYPFPELVSPDRDWKVWGAPKDLGRMNKVEKEMQVPLSHSKRDLAVRAHELGHLKWSPTRPHFNDVHPEWAYVVEEMRINNLLMSKADVNLDELHYGDLPPPAAMVPEAIELPVAVGYAICMWKLKGHRKQLMAIDKQAFRYAEETYKKLFADGNFPTYEDGLEVARWLEKKLVDPPKSPKQDGGGDDGREEEVTPPVPMTIKTALLTAPSVDPKKAIYKRSPAEEGSLFIAPHRWCVDRAVFDRRKKKPSATLLIDISGSMQMRNSALTEILLKAPMATIAAYHGRGDSASLTIIAKDGRRAEPGNLPRTGGGNECDELALLWLGKQLGPRYWVSDGGVTTSGDNISKENSMNCRKAIKRANIKQILCLDDAVEVFHGRQKPLPQPYLAVLDYDFMELRRGPFTSASRGIVGSVKTVSAGGLSYSVTIDARGMKFVTGSA